MIARIEVVRGTLTEYPIAEKVVGGWQNGVTFYPDADVAVVLGEYVYAGLAPVPDREVGSPDA